MGVLAKYALQLVISKAFNLVLSVIHLFITNQKSDKKIEDNSNEKDRTKAASTAADILFK